MFVNNFGENTLRVKMTPFFSASRRKWLPLSSNPPICRCIRVSWRFRAIICFECRQQAMEAHVRKVPILAGRALRCGGAALVDSRSACIRHRIIAHPRHFQIVLLMVVKLDGRTSNESQSVLHHQREAIVALPENTRVVTNCFDFVRLPAYWNGVCARQ